MRPDYTLISTPRPPSLDDARLRSAADDAGLTAPAPPARVWPDPLICCLVLAAAYCVVIGHPFHAIVPFVVALLADHVKTPSSIRLAASAA